MNANFLARLSEVEGHAEFLNNFMMGVRTMLVAHMEAMEELFPGVAKATAARADMHRRSALHIGEQGWADSIETLQDEIRERFDLPAND